ncbi:MAG TPA: tripartite tricarboxylate transporter substrate binding protein [Burkholderiales bacterium]|nr:tripartite tricarboxylate transporter substrate binding protein [Burkholderiales bacterium]
MSIASIALIVAVAAASIGTPSHAAQPYPVRSIRYVVPQAPGGSSDTLARIVASRLAERLGQQVIVDNRPGATGVIGAEVVAKAPADGYTLVQVATSHATNPALGVKLPFDTLRDFAPVTLLSQQPNVWIVHPSLPAHNMRELIALAKARPGQIDFASSGTGGSQHLAGELLNVMAGIKLVHIPYKGSPPALIDVLGGRVPLMSSTLAPAMPHARNGKVRALAVTGAHRSSAAPEIPTVAESGLPGYEAIAWQGVLAPAGTPREAVQRLHAELVTVIAQQDARKQLAEQGYEPAGTTPEQFAAFIRTEIAKWSKVVKAAHITVE